VPPGEGPLGAGGALAAPSASLRTTLGFVLPVLRDAVRRLVEHPRMPELYVEYLVASHGIIRASVPLMHTALERARAAPPKDPAAADLAAYLERHADEELGHDDWLLEDLEELGVAREEVLARPPSPAVAAFVGAQYYWILHHHPVAIMGYIALLEGYPPTIADVDRMMAATGHGREAFRTLIRHAELDPLHRDEFEEALDAMTLTEEQSSLIVLSALHSVDAFTRVIVELLDDAR
jgi:hypothetical protein